MIDTDKYEGHTEGPWIMGKDGKYDRYIALEPDDDYYEGETWVGITNGERDLRESDAQLIADAPLLLAEVKTLRVSDATLSAIAELIDPEGVLQNNENLLTEVARLLTREKVMHNE